MLLQRTAVLAAAGVAEFPFIDNPIVGAGFWPARFTALGVMRRYLFLLVWPATLSIDYSYNQIPIASAGLADWIALALAVACSAVAIRFRRLNRPAFFFAAFAAIAFLPASNLLFASGTIMAERLAYLPSAGLVVAGTLLLFAFASSPRRRLVATAVAAVIVVAGVARTWVRNKDWKDDVTIWSAAVAASPASSKAHRALAEALYNADPTHANLDRVIAEGEQSVRLLESLPDELSSFQSYRQAAASHLDRAEALRRAGGTGAPLSDEARRSYDRAIALTAKGLAVASASSARIGADATRQQADARRLNAAAYLGLGDSARAVDEAEHARQLDPLQPLAHRLLADAYLAGRHGEQAAIALMVGSMLTADAGFRLELLDLYRVGFGGGGCALTDTAAGVVLNPACPMVRDHLCAASAASIALNLRIGRRTEADVLRQTAAMQLRCAGPMP